jgi:hypothetical protein
MTQRVTGLERLLMSRTTTPVVLRKLTSASSWPAGIVDVHLNAIGGRGFDPPGEGLGSVAGLELGEATGLPPGAERELDAWPSAAGWLPQAARTKSTEARAAALIQALTQIPTGSYVGSI